MAGGFKAPGIKRIETDLSEIVAPAGTSTGALVGPTSKGPTNRRVLITSDKQLIDTFGAPTCADTDMAIYAGLEFLKESNSLYFVRATDESSGKYAGLSVPMSSANYSSPQASAVAAVATSTILANDQYSDGNTPRQVDGRGGIYELEQQSVPSTSAMHIGALGPGIYGNDVGISIVTCADTDYRGQFGFNWEMNYDDATPTSYMWYNTKGVSAMGSPSSADTALWKKVYRINVYKKPVDASESYWGLTSAETPIETYLVSNHKISDAQGKNLYAPDVINGASEYIYLNVNEYSYPMSTLKTSGGNAPALSNAASALNSIEALEGGTTDKTINENTKMAAWTLFNDREKSTPNILIVGDRPSSSDTGGNDVIGTIKHVGNLAATRLDCIAVGQVGATNEENTQSIIDKANQYYSFNNPSYVALYAGYDFVNDTFTGQTINFPKAIFGAGLMARTDAIANTWDAPAGINRGIIGRSSGQIRKYNEGEIGTLYDSNINTSKFIQGVGNVMWGQKTAQRKKTALDRINVRRLLLYIQNSVEPTLLPFLFEPNSAKTRSRVFSIIDSFMSTIFADDGVTKYQIVVDESNNTSEVIDNNQLNVDIYVQPTRTIEFIQLQTVITRTGVNFSEV
jgi:phage tail sheath protein FI